MKQTRPPTPGRGSPEQRQEALRQQQAQREQRQFDDFNADSGKPLRKR